MPLASVKKVLMFCAHTDDEMICAGTLHRLVKAGASVLILAFSQCAVDGDRLGTSVNRDSLKEWENSLKIIGAKGGCLMMTPSANLGERGQEICQWAYNNVETYKPDVVFTLSPEDENPAHAVVGVQTERVMRGRVPVVIRCQFPWNYATGRANLYVKLSEEDVAAKRAVAEAYVSQKFRYNYSEMLLAYARADGLSVKAEYAEKFEMIRSVI